MQTVADRERLLKLARAANLARKTLDLTPILPGERGDRLALSFAQQRLWFLEQLGSAGRAYHIPTRLRLHGELDREALRRALDAIVERHEVLRTVFRMEDGEPVQVIGPAGGFHLVEHEVGDEAELRRLAGEEAAAPFDLENGPLARGRLIRLAADDHVLLVTMHHIVSDGWSMEVVVRELCALYAAFRDGAADPLAPLPIQYADYASWQRRWVTGEVLQRQADYWKTTLAGAPDLLELPADRPRPAQQDTAGAVVTLELDEALTAGLKALGQRHGTTLFMTLMAGWATLLARLSGQDDVVIGTPTANRGRKEVEGLIGFFVNTLAVRTDLAGSPSVAELLGRVKARALGAQDHQDIPFEQVVELVKPARSMAHTPLFQVMFSWQNAPKGGVELPGLRLGSMGGAEHVTAKVDLSLSLHESAGRLLGGVEYATALFDRATVERYVGYLRLVLEGMVADDTRGVDHISILPPAERVQVVEACNATDAEFPRDTPVHELFAAQVRRAPDAVAVVCDGVQLTYTELDGRANRLARHLVERGVVAGERVGILVPRSLELVVAELAILKAGAVYVPVDPSSPADRTAFMVADSGARIVLGRAGETLPELPGTTRIDVDALPAGDAGALSVEATGESAAYVMYTSGSTGTPKGVVVPHRAIVRLVINNGYADFGAEDRVAFAANPAFDATTMEVWGPLLNGGCVVVVGGGVLQEPEAFARLLRDEEITALFITTAVFNQYAASIPGALAGLRCLMTGGEAADPSSFARVLREGGSGALIHCYGPTETTTFAMTHRVAHVAEGARTVPLGGPISNTRVYLLDAAGEPVPTGVTGELYIGGPGVALGYLNRPEFTGERFVADRFGGEPGARLYRTGDLGRRLADGTIEFLGRNDFQVKIRGFRIELGEIEARLLAHPEVGEAVVLARQDAPGERRLVAYYVAPHALEAEALRDHVRERLPEYMAPVAYVRLEAMPLTPNGKIDRKALPAPDGGAFATRAYAAPVGETEEALAALWCELLKVERVGRHDNFFELGGHSLLAVSLIERMRKEGLPAEVRALFATPTLAELAASVGGVAPETHIPANLIPAGCAAITPELLPLVALSQAEIDGIVARVAGGAENVQDIYPLAPLQEGILFHHLMAEEGDPYLLLNTLSFDTRDRVDAFVGALQAVVARHDILRTAVMWDGLPEPVQVVLRHAPVVVEEVELGEGDAARELRARFDPRRHRIDLGQAPLLRGYLARDAKDGRWLLLVLLHHLAGDHTTMDVLRAEVQAHLEGRAAELPAALPFRNLVAQARLGVSRAEHEEFFRGMLGDVVEPTAPFGLLDVQGDGRNVSDARMDVEPALAARLRERARRLGVSAASLCHVAFAQVLARVSGRDDVVFGTVLFGRMNGGEGADRVVGLFINTLPVRLRVAAEGAEATVRGAQTLLAGLMRHEHASLALAQRCSGVQAPAPLFSALLNYRHGGKAAPAAPARAWEGLRGLGHEERTNYPLTLSVDDLGEGFRVTTQVSATVGADRVCALMLTALEGLVDALESAPSTPVRALPVLPAAELRRVVEEWNATDAEFPRHTPIHELVQAQAERAPQAIALVHDDRTLTYAELDARANQLANHLRDRGVAADDRVAVLVPRSLELVVAELGVLKAGAVYVPIEPSAPAERIAYMVADSGSRVMLGLQGAALAELPGVERVDVDALPAELSAEDPRVARSSDAGAYVMYTSGSTGQPKGVLVPHRAIARLLINNGYAEFNEQDRVAFGANPAFDATTVEVWAPLLHGGRIVVIAQGVLLDPDALTRLLAEQGVTVLFLTTAIFNQHAAAIPHVLAGLRYVLTGGEAADPSAFARVLREGGTAALVNCYGPTEAATMVTTHRVTHVAEGARSIPLGRPLSNTRIYIVDAHGEPVPVGAQGEILAGGPGVALGYLNRPELTEERFIIDRFGATPGARLYRTGDLGRWLPDGTIEYLGRNDFQVKIRGFRIELGEIEARLAAYEGIREVAVLAREDVPGDKRLVAYYVGAAGVEALRAHLAEQLPDYMVPSAFVRLDALPLTLNGKVDRKALPAPEGDAIATREYEAPVGEVETALAGIWSSVLGVERIGRNDHFFALGGHSLLAVQAISRVRQALGVEVALGDLFARPVLADYARGLKTAARSELAPIEPARPGDRAALSFAQQRLWFIEQMGGTGSAYHIRSSMRLQGELHRDALGRALDRVVERHEALRTVFRAVDGEPVQRVEPASGFRLVDHDLTTHADAEAELRRLAAEETAARFDLEHGPLIRGRLIRMAADEHVLLVTMHHIVSDGWSMGVLTQEMSALYAAFLNGDADPLPALPVQYADYAAWQRKWVEGEVLQEQADYWKTTLAGAPELLELPADHARPSVQSYAGAFAALELDEALTAELRALSQRHGTTLYMTVLAAWAALLGRLAGQDEVVIGTPTANRGRAEIEGLVGFFVNTLALRLGATGTVAELLEGVKARVLAAQDHQDIPFEQVVELVQPARSLAHTPLFQAMFAWQSSARRGAGLPGLTLRPVGTGGPAGAVATFDLSLDLQDAGGRIAGGVTYATSLYEAATIERYLGYLRAVLAAMVAGDGAVERVSILPAAERVQLVETFNAGAEHAEVSCVHALFEAWAERTPHATAVIHNGEPVTYGELNERANRLAHHLRAAGVGPDARVAVCAGRTPEMLAAILAVLKAGGAYVPLDPAYPADRIRYMLEDSAPVAVLAQDPALFAGMDVPVLGLDAAAVEGQPATNPAPASAPEHLAYVIYTSGSTGMPKGVMVEHRNVCRQLAALRGTLHTGPADRLLQFASFTFDASVEEIFGALTSGAALVLRDDAWLEGAESFWARCAENGVSVIDLPTRFWQLLASEPSVAVPACVRVLFIGGEAVDRTVLAAWFGRAGHLPRLLNGYGPTEATVNATIQELTAEPSTWRAIGRPVSGTRAYILDAHGEPVPMLATGELHIGGGQVARGYLGRPELTEERFVADPFSGGRMYRTGDLARWLPDGTIEYLGRNDFQVKIRGFRIELGEIEARLLEQVREAVVIAREDVPGDRRIVAYYTGDASPETLRACLAEQLPEYMVPAAYVRLDAMPLTTSGKLDRKALPAPEGDAFATRGYEAPAGGLEEALAAIWAEVLGVERIGRRDSFFGLGGHSLLAVRVVSRVRQALGVEVALGDLFARPVLADFAGGLATAVRAELPAIEPAPRDGPLALSFAQQRLWFLDQLGGAGNAYHMPSSLRLRGELDRDALGRALDRIVERHEALRTVFRTVEGAPVQVIQPAGGFRLAHHDLTGSADAEAELRRIAAEEAGAAFDLQHGPLVRGRLVRMAADDHVLLVTLHHIVSDGWSMGVVTQELGALYGAFRSGAADPLPALPVQYADYAAWQRKWVDGEVLQRQADYWKTTLAGAPELLELPADHARPAQQSHAGAAVSLELDEDLTAGLKALSQRHGTTLFMTLMAGWAAVLGRLSGQQDVVIGTPTANRGRREVEGLIGFFVNTLALRVELGGTPTVAELLGRVKERALAAQDHQDIPFEQVVERVQPARSLSHTPLFQVMFTWQNVGGGSLELDGIKLGAAASGAQVTAKFDLSLSMQEAGGRIVGGATYATALFEQATVERYLGYLRMVLSAMVADERQTVDRLAILPAAERVQVVETFNATDAEFPSESCIHHLFEAQVERTPDAIAVAFEDTHLTYSELNARANQLAHYLRERGVGPDARVGICVERSLEMMVALLGVLKAGGGYVPLDAAYPEDRLRHMLTDSAPVVLLTQGSLAGLFAWSDVPRVDLFAFDGSDRPAGNPEGAARPDQLAYVIYTSGSTGMPKGVMNEHRGVVNRLVWMQAAYGLQANEAVLQKTPFSFDVSVWEFFWALLAGARVVMARPEGHKDPAYLVEAIRSAEISTLHFVPSMLQLFLEHAEVESCTGLRQVMCSGEALPVALVRRFHERLPGVELHNLYGPTEAAVDVTAWHCTPEATRVRVPIGKPIWNTRMYVLDAAGEPVPVGVTGELFIGGVQVARGYLNRDELTAERFVRDPFTPGGRMYRTGDLGRWLADGSIEYLGRNDFQVKIRGFRIELGEIETRLAEHAEIREAVVLAREDAPGEKRLVAYYVAPRALEVDALRAHLLEALPEHMVPAAYVWLERMPLTPNGKADRKALPAPDAGAFAAREYEAPLGETEQALAAVWAELLGVERVGRRDNFFELGGHSLLAVTLIERMRERGLRAEVRALFATPTLAELAAAVGGAPREVEVPANLIPAGCAAITPEMLPLVALTQAEIASVVAGVPGGAENVQDIYPLAPVQEGILFHHLMATDGDPYLLLDILTFETRPRLDDFLRALQAVVDRHDILRTAVVWDGLPEPVQVVWRQAPLRVEEHEMDPAGGAVMKQLAARFDPRHHRVDVRHAPILRMHVARDEANGRWALAMLRHHLVCDHTTMEVLPAEVQAFLAGEVLPETLPFRNFVAQARLGVSRAEHEEFFTRMLGTVDEPTAPFGLLDVQGDGRGIAEDRVMVDAGLAVRLRERARVMGVSAASLCHVAFAQVLARVSGRQDVVFGTVLFGRMQGGAGADRVMGPFINTLPVRMQVGDAAVDASVRSAQTLLADLLRHEHASLALAQRCSGVKPPVPLFSALLNYRHSTVRPTGATGRAISVQGHFGEERTNYPLTLSVDDMGDGFGISAQVVAAVEPLRVCALMHGALEGLVEALETAPATPLARVDVLPAAERALVVETFNATDAEFPSESCIHHLFEAQVERTPDAVAVAFEDTHLTYRELNARANQLAHYLRERGVGPDARVGICVERSLEMMVALLGVLKAGGGYVPLDAAYPEDRLRHMLTDSAPVVLLTHGSLAGLFAWSDVPRVDLFAFDGSDRPAENPEGAARPDQLAYVIYTSGSTGMPKGVMNEHRGVVNRLVWMQAAYGLQANEAVLQKTPFSFDVSVWEFFWALLAGARVVMARPEGHKDPAYLVETIRTAEISTLHFVPSMLQLFLEHAEVESCTGLRQVMCSGEALPVALVRRFHERLPGVELHNLYGPTEAAVDVTAWHCTPEATKVRVPIGKPIWNTRMYVLDAAGEPVPVGVTGELFIGGVQVARGYLNRDELTAERFVRDPFSAVPGARMYRTGDLGRWLSDGSIEYLGRNDFQVKIRGFRIELGEIEACLAGHPEVREAVVLARENGAGDKRLAAYYTAAAELPVEALRAHLGERLPEYMVPAAYVWLDALPLTPNGKVDRKALPAPEGDAFSSRGYEAPAGEMEEALAAVWAEVLGVERIGRHDSFFELGGHSLVAVRVVSRVRQVMEIEVALGDLFARPVLADFARGLASAARSELPAIVPAERGERVALSFAQQRLWFLEQLGGSGRAYHMPGGLRLHGELDRDALVRALDRIVERHEALRTTFRTVDGEPVQVIQPANGFALGEHDLGGHADAEAELSRIAAEEAGAAFDLEHGPLIRGRLVKVGADDHALLVTMHHIVSDGWSMGVLTQELSALYGAFQRGDADPLAPLPVQYADYAAWQRKWVDGEVLQQQADYWKTTLSGAPELLEVPTDHVRPLVQSHAGAVAGVELDEELTAALKALSQRHGTTLFMTLMAAWATVLSRLSGQDDVVIGTPTANRGRREIESLIGFFVNTLAVRMDLSGAPTVAELLGRVKERALGAQDHQDIPFEQVVDLVQPARSMAHSPLFQVSFAWQNNPKGSLELPGLKLGSVGAAAHTTAKFDLALEMQEAGGRIVGGVTYATSLFEEATIERYLGYLRAVLAAMAADEQQTVDRLPLLSAGERLQVVEEWNATDAEFPRHTPIHELVQAQAERAPQAIALVHDDRTLTYAELDARANQLANYLRTRGVQADDRVAVLVPRSLELVVAELGVLKAGAVYVPIDPSAPAERIAYMVADSGSRVMLGLQGAALAELPGVERVDVDALPADLSAEDPRVARSSDEGAYVMYTSGSTGQPKGVLVPHRAIARLLINNGYAEFNAQDRVAFGANPAFDATTVEVWAPLLHGGRIVVIAQGVLLDPDALTRLLAEQGVTVLFLTTAIFNQHAATIPHVLAGLRYVLTGGEAADPSAFARVLREGGTAALVNCYGPTEAATMVTTHRVTHVAEGARSIPLGRPLSNTRIYIVDAQGEPVPAGVKGEILAGGPGVALGYLGRPELTEARFITDRFTATPGARLYRTGDLGRWLPDGTIEYLGRNDFQVKIRGFRIELGEIEARLAAYESIREVAVLAREDVPGDKRLVAYYAAAEALEAETLRAHLAEGLPDYMVPSAFVWLEALPLTLNGKVDRKALPAPEGDAFAVRAYEAPLGDIETAVAEIWSELLRAGQVGRRDNFFSLGGHSLLAVQVISRVRQALGVEVALGDLFLRPVLADFARGLETATRAELPALVPAERGDEVALSFAQQRLWFLEQMGSAGRAYHMPTRLRLRGELDRDALVRALDRIVERHEALRTTFHSVDGQPVQRVAPASGFALVQHDLTGHADAEAELRQIAAEESDAAFDLEHGPLVRGRLVKIAADDHALLVTMHHIVSDGWSMGVLTGELSTLYTAFRNGGADPLPALPVQYADYAAWQRKWVDGEVLQQQVDYWKTTLSGAPELLELPTDHVRPLVQSHAGASAGLELDEELTAGLKALSQRHGTTLFMTLMAAWATVLGRLSGQEDVVIGTPTANRGRREIEGLIGFFVNTLAVRMDLGGAPTVAELLRRVKERALGAQDHQDIPFEQVVELVQPVRSRAHSPLFQVMFTWQNTLGGSLELPGLTLGSVGAPSHTAAKFDLSLDMQESGGRIVGGVTYATSLFEAATIDRYLGYLRAVLRAMVADEQAAVHHIALLGDDERRQVVETFNTTDTPFAVGPCVHELFEEQAARRPHATALVHLDTTLTYAELNARANRLAHYLRGRGVGPDARVAVCMERTPGLVVALLAILKAGGSYVPLDPAYPADRLGYMLDDSAPVALLTQASLAGRFAETRVPVIDVEAEAAAWAGHPGTDPARAGLTAEHVAYVIYTSGSTGRPKGTEVPHRAFTGFFRGVGYLRFDETQVLLQHSSTSWDAAALELWAALCEGGTCVLFPGARSEPSVLGAQVKAHGVTTLWIPSAYFNSIIDSSPEILAGVAQIVVGGEALSVPHIRRAQQLYPGLRLANGYGPTECMVFSTCWPIPAGFDGQSVPIGRPIGDRRAYVLDRYRNPAPVGVPGELYVGGPAVARGYLGRAALTADRFVPDPFAGEPGARLYRTGDRVRWRGDGALEFMGRVDFQVKVRGFRVEPGEIEATLTGHPAVREAVVTVHESTPGDRRLVGYVCTEGDAAPGGAELREWLRERLPEYMVPSAVLVLDRLPLTANGKVDRRALPAPDGSAYAGREYEAPVGEVEEALAAIWAEVLGVERVGRRDNFFELGGHSLLVVKLLERMRRQGLHVEAGAMFSTPTLAELAGVVGEESGEVVVPANLIPDAEPSEPETESQDVEFFL